MADTTTTNYAFVLPEIAASDDTWGNKNNANWTEIDAVAADFEDRIAAVEAATGSLTASALLTLIKTVDGPGTGLDADLLDGQHGAYYLPTTSYTAADVLAKLLTVDGAGSGLDADLLDGQSSAYYATAAGLTSLTATVSAIGGAQPGQVAIFAMAAVPSGYLECNGAAVSRATYSALFTAIGTTFGTGDGSTTFNLPDLRGEFVRGYDNGRGVDTGRAFGSAQDVAGTVPNTGWGTSGGNLGTVTSGTLVVGSGALESAEALESLRQSGGTNTLTGDVRPRNVALLYCIKT